MKTWTRNILQKKLLQIYVKIHIWFDVDLYFYCDTQTCSVSTTSSIILAFLQKKKFFALDYLSALWFVRIKNSLKTQKYENHLNDILGCLINQFLHELNDMNLFLQCNKLKNYKTCWKYCKISVFSKKDNFWAKIQT